MTDLDKEVAVTLEALSLFVEITSIKSWDDALWIAKGKYWTRADGTKWTHQNPDGTGAIVPYNPKSHGDRGEMTQDPKKPVVEVPFGATKDKIMESIVRQAGKHLSEDDVKMLSTMVRVPHFSTMDMLQQVGKKIHMVGYGKPGGEKKRKPFPGAQEVSGGKPKQTGPFAHFAVPEKEAKRMVNNTMTSMSNMGKAFKDGDHKGMGNNALRTLTSLTHIVNAATDEKKRNTAGVHLEGAKKSLNELMPLLERAESGKAKSEEVQKPAMEFVRAAKRIIDTMTAA